MQKTIIIVFSFLLILGCRDEYEIINLNNNTISAVGHGGMGIEHTYPINSFESIQNCLSIGADGTEIDVQMTSDHVLVAFHDERLEHSTHNSGQIFTKTWEEIKGASFKFPPYTDYKVRTLDEIFDNIDNKNDFTFFLDIKKFKADTSSVFIDKWINAISDLIDKHSLHNSTFVEFKSEQMIQAMKNHKPETKMFIYSSFEKGLELGVKYELEGITTPVNEISNEQVIEAHNDNLMIAVFNAHSKGRNIDAIKLNVDFVQSDKVKYLIKVLGE